MTDKKEEQRTKLQNRAMHKYFSLLSESLNAAGYDVSKTLRHDIDIPWNESLVKELLWRRPQIAITGKESTTELNTKEVSEVYEILNKHLGEKLGIHVPWPRNKEKP